MIFLETRFHGDDVRLPLRPAHREKMTAMVEEGILLFAGPFEDASGGFMIFDADRERVQRAIDADPYLTCSDVEIIHVKEWTPLLGTLTTNTA